MLFKNIAGQKAAVYAYLSTTGAPVANDQANITAYINGVQSNDVNPTQLHASYHPGIYVFDLTAGETNCDLLVLSAVSATPNVQIEPLIAYTQGGAIPKVAAGAEGGVPVLPAGAKLAVTLAAADVSGNVPADLQTVKTKPATASADAVAFPAAIGTSTLAAGAAMTLTTDYDAAKTAAAAGAKMDLIDAPNATALTAIAAAIWNALTAGFATANSIGKKLADWVILTSQAVRDAMKLAPTAGDPTAGSVDKHLDDALTGIAAIPINPYTGTPPTVAAIRAEMEGAGTKLTLTKDQTDKLAFSGSDVKATLDSEKVDFVDAPNNTAVAAIQDGLARDLTVAKAATALTKATWTDARAAKIDNLDGRISDIPGVVGAGLATISDGTLDVTGAPVGKITTNLDVPIAGAIVGVYADADTGLVTLLYQGTTDGDGGFSIQVASGATYRVRAISSGYSFAVKRVTV